MPKGPQGQKRPADAVANAVMVARIATGEIEEIEISGRAAGKTAGGNARAAKLAPNVRAEIASKAAKARWSKGKSRAMTMQTTQGAGADCREAVRMYPDNRLPPQMRDVSETPSVFAVVKQAFTKKV